MPASTRSKTAQTKLEDFATSGDTQTGNSKTAIGSLKRKTLTKQPSKSSKLPKRRPSADDPANAVNAGGKVTINRAAVLKLWAATVAQFVHPSISWHPTALSAGGAISAICAISKGRAIGEIAPKDEHKDEHEKQEKELHGGETLSVMQFKLKLNESDEYATVGSKVQKVSEESIEKSFGEESYHEVRNTFLECLEEWKDDKDELDQKAFKMYERFRPTVTGWGKKGVLDLDVVRRVIGHPSS